MESIYKYIFYINRVMSDMEMKFASQKQENTRLQGDIQKLKIVKTSLEGELIGNKNMNNLDLIFHRY